MFVFLTRIRDFVYSGATVSKFLLDILLFSSVKQL